MDRTGMHMGRVSACIYFENQSGHIILPPVEIGQGTALARQIYEQRYKNQGYEWREAETWHDYTLLQERLQQQELKRAIEMKDKSMASYDAAKAKTAADLRQRMQSSDCDNYEREFIRLWLEMAPEKRKKYEEQFSQRSWFLWSAEMDANRKVEERMPSQPGEFWRNESQQKA